MPTVRRAPSIYPGASGPVGLDGQLDLDRYAGRQRVDADGGAGVTTRLAEERHQQVGGLLMAAGRSP